MTASALRSLLRAAEIPYTAVVRVRNRRFDTVPTAVHRVDVPIVSVGNLTLGGTGKTPMVRWIVQWLLDRGMRPAIVSRGYGSRHSLQNDEALELAHTLADVPHVQNPDRVAAASEAVRRFGSSVIVLDDAFQHRRIGRDLDLVLLDAAEPFGFGHVFPRGTLREPAAGLRRADAVVLSRADLLPPAARREIRKEAERLAPGAGWAEAAHSPQALLSISGERHPLDSLRGQTVAAFCGIGNPVGFRHTLQSCGYELVGLREFADHHRYTASDLDSLAGWADGLGASTLVCTHKDLVKLQTFPPPKSPLLAVLVGVEFLAGQDAIESQLAKVVSQGGGPSAADDAGQAETPRVSEAR